MAGLFLNKILFHALNFLLFSGTKPVSYFPNIKSLLHISVCQLMCQKECKIFIIINITGNEACFIDNAAVPLIKLL
jgi:hypothetical protein